jgi:hypothetical protein
VRAWAAGVTGESTRDNPQRLLLGTQANIMAYGAGTGMIPKKCLDAGKMTLARGVSGLYDTVIDQALHQRSVRWLERTQIQIV